MKIFRLNEEKIKEEEDGFISEFCIIPSDCTTLDLKKFKLYNRSALTLNRALSFIPSTITEIDFSFNSLHLKTAEELKQAFSGLDKNIQKVNISFNGLENFSEVELIAIISAMRFVKTVIITVNSFTNEKREKLVANLHQFTEKNIITNNSQNSFSLNSEKSLFFIPEKKNNGISVEKKTDEINLAN